MEPELRETGEDQPMVILLSEVKYAIKLEKIHNAPGKDNIYAEMLKLLDDKNLKRLTYLLNKIYCSGNLPRDWTQSVFIPIPNRTAQTNVHNIV